MCSLFTFGQGEKLEVEGAIIIDNNDDPNPVAGTIRWTGTDFEGFDGTNWLSLTCCDATPTSVTDQDGNVIPIAYIGNQCWMAENLRVTTFNDGTPINFANSPTSWAGYSANGQMIPAYSWLLDDPNNAIPYGATYNWNAINSNINGGKNICPQGWHVPTSADMLELFNFLDPNGLNNASQIAGGLLKATGDLTSGTGLWAAPNTGATDAYNFSAIPTIRRNTGGSWFQSAPATDLKLWTYEAFAQSIGTVMTMKHDEASLITESFSSGHGFPCRCIKD